MEIIGKLIELLPEQSGTSERGAWVRGGFVIEYQDGSYPRNAAFTLFGENRIQSVKNIPMGAQVRVEFSVASRKYQDRWYTDLSCFRVEPYNQAAYPQSAPAYQQPYPQQGFAPNPYAQPQQPVYQQQQPVYPQQPQQPQSPVPPVYQQTQPQGGSFDAMPDANQEDDLPF